MATIPGYHHAQAAAAPPIIETRSGFPPFEHPLFLYHLPKTGGTTIDYVMTAWTYLRDLHHGAHRWNPPARERLDPDAPFLSGHWVAGTHRQLARPVHTITVLRDPAARLASHYLFFARKGTIPARIRGTDPDLSALRAFLATPTADNLQTRMLAAVPDDAPVTTADRDRARAFLDTMDFVGVMDRLDDLIARLISGLLGCDLLGFRAQEQSSDHRCLAAQVAEIIAADHPACLTHDAVLYARAQERARALAGELREHPRRASGRILLIPPAPLSALAGRGGNRLPIIADRARICELIANQGYDGLMALLPPAA